MKYSVFFCKACAIWTRSRSKKFFYLRALYLLCCFFYLCNPPRILPCTVVHAYIHIKMKLSSITNVYCCIYGKSFEFTTLPTMLYWLYQNLIIFFLIKKIYMSVRGWFCVCYIYYKKNMWFMIGKLRMTHYRLKSSIAYRQQQKTKQFKLY